MKKPLYCLLLLSASAFAGTGITYFGTGGGSVIFAPQVMLVPGGSFPFLQAKFCSTNSSPTGNCAFDTNITAHSLLIVGCEYFLDTGNTMQVLDNNGNTWSTGTVVSSNGGDHRVGVYYALNANAGATTITCRDNAAVASYIQQSIHEYQATASAAFDMSNSSSAMASFPPMGNPLLTTTPNEFVFAFAGKMGGLASGGSGNIRTNNADNSYQASEDTVVPVVGTYVSSFTTASDNNWVLIQASFK